MASSIPGGVLRFVLYKLVAEGTRQRLERVVMEHRFKQRYLVDSVLLRGPFKGMKYPDLESHCSSLSPKFLGTYEWQVSEKLMTLLDTYTYDVFLDIGAAEGYYAVGVARKQSECAVLAIDIEPDSLESCKSMASMNGVLSQFTFSSESGPQLFKQLNKGKRSLVMCDCEGCEASIFSADSVQDLTHSDVIIELHDRIVPDIKDRLQSAFHATHEIEWIMETQADFRRVREELQLPYSDYEMKLLLSENRDGVFGKYRMCWAICTPK